MDTGPTCARNDRIFVSPFVFVMYFLFLCSATPKLYLAKAPGAKSETESDDHRKGIKKNKSGNEKSIMASQELSHRAWDTAEKVKASAAMVSVGPGSQQSGTAEEAVTAPGRKKEKKNKKIIRMAGGQIWEDNSLLEWEDGERYCVLVVRPSWWRITRKMELSVCRDGLY